MTEDYVSLETAKLLKEKGFDEEVKAFYSYDSEFKIYDFQEDDRWDTPNDWGDYYWSVPTLQMAMKWLREVHDLHIIAYPWKADREERAIHWCCQVYKSFNLLGYEKYTNETLKTYEEACETAIKYCLEKLI